MVSLIEQTFVSGASDDEIDAVVAELGPSDVAAGEAYLAARRERPSEPDRFVVYAASVTTSQQQVVYIDATLLDADAIASYAQEPGESTTRVAGTSGAISHGGQDCLRMF